MSAVMREVDFETRLKKAHIKLIKHPETCLYGGVILMGESSIIDDPNKCPTAYTDGFNKRYGREFMEKLSDQEVAGVVLHENLHVLLKHVSRNRDLTKRNPRLANIAADYVVNDIIIELSKKDKTLISLPKNCFYDPMFSGWSVRRVFEYLEKEQESGKGGGRPQESFDEHDGTGLDGMTPQDIETVEQRVDEAIQEGSIIAGRFGAKIPRVIKELMAPQVDWREVLQEFWVSAVRGSDELTWRRFNKHRLADDYYLPSSINETVGEVILAIDTSGSISNDDIGKVATHIRELCESVTPERIRVLWWDTKVHGEQVFEGNYENITSLLKPMGGGGTRVSSVSDYILNKNLTADCVIVFTDGYLEDDIKWRVDIPALWLITQGGSRSFVPPRGGKIQIND